MDKHFSIGDLLKYTLPTMAMAVFVSVYGIVDGYFVSNYAGETAFAALNLILSYVMILSSVGFMFGAGGSALIAKTLGEGDDALANKRFSMVVYAAVALGVVLSVVGVFTVRPVAVLLGAQGELLELAVLYGQMSMISLTGFILQSTFQVLFSTAGKPGVGLRVTIVAGVANMVLDWLFVGVFDWGIVGAAAATNVSEWLGAIIPLVYFARQRSGCYLRLGRAVLSWRDLGQVCLNGSSEMVADVALSLVGMLYNWQLLRLIGEDGVAAYGVIMYLWLVFGSILLGYATGSAPLLSYQHGARNVAEMKSLLRKGFIITLTSGVGMCVLAEALAVPFASLFVGYDADLLALSVGAFRTYVLSFSLLGISVFIAAVFTALNNGLVSAAIEFIRTIVCEMGAVLAFPLLFGAEAIWWAVVFAEIVASVLSVVLLWAWAPRYGLRSSKRRLRGQGCAASEGAGQGGAVQGNMAQECAMLGNATSGNIAPGDAMLGSLALGSLAPGNAAPGGAAPEGAEPRG